MRLVHVVVLGAAVVIGMVPLHAQNTAISAPAKAPLVAVPVLDRAIAKGDVLGIDDFVTRDVSVAQARAVPLVKDVVGMEALRALSAGAIVRRSDVIRQQLVRRGEPVTIALRDGGLSITAPGRALGSGAKGDFVRVVSLSTNQTLDGVVEGTGAIRVSAR